MNFSNNEITLYDLEAKKNISRMKNIFLVFNIETIYHSSDIIRNI